MSTDEHPYPRPPPPSSPLLQRRRVKLTPEETSDFYAEHYGKPDFSSMIAYMSKGPIVALVLAKGPETVAEWLELIGLSATTRPTTQSTSFFLVNTREH